MKYAVMVEGKQTPAKLYNTYQDAEIEAIRLCVKEGRVTYVLQVVATVEVQPKVTMLIEKL